MAEASKMIQRAESTVRTWIKTGQVRAQQDAAGWWRIERNSLLTHAAADASKRGVTQKGSAQVLTSPPPQQTPLEKTLMEALSRERHLNDDLRNQLKQLDAERTQHLAEMRALLSKDVKAADGILSRWLRR